MTHLVRVHPALLVDGEGAREDAETIVQLRERRVAVPVLAQRPLLAAGQLAVHLDAVLGDRLRVGADAVHGDTQWRGAGRRAGGLGVAVIGRVLLLAAVKRVVGVE